MGRKADMYGGKDPRELPAYTATEVAHYLDLAPSTVRAWVFGQKYMAAGQAKRFQPVIKVADKNARLLSFKNLVELHVLSSLRRKHKIKLEHIRKAVKFVERELRTAHPLLHPDIAVDENRNLLVEALDHLVNVSQDMQLEMKQVVLDYLRRIERDDHGIPVRLYPLYPGTGDERPVEINPRVQFGRPCLKGKGIPVDVIADRFLAGEKIPDIAADYKVEADEVEAALRFTARQKAA